MVVLNKLTCKYCEKPYKGNNFWYRLHLDRKHGEESGKGRWGWLTDFIIHSIIGGLFISSLFHFTIEDPFWQNPQMETSVNFLFWRPPYELIDLSHSSSLEEKNLNLLKKMIGEGYLLCNNNNLSNCLKTVEIHQIVQSAKDPYPSCILALYTYKPKNKTLWFLKMPDKVYRRLCEDEGCIEAEIDSINVGNEIATGFKGEVCFENLLINRTTGDLAKISPNCVMIEKSEIYPTNNDFAYGRVVLEPINFAPEPYIQYNLSDEVSDTFYQHTIEKGSEFVEKRVTYTIFIENCRLNK